MIRALALLVALVLAACAGPSHVTRGGMEQIARDWHAMDQERGGR